MSDPGPSGPSCFLSNDFIRRKRNLTGKQSFYYIPFSDWMSCMYSFLKIDIHHDLNFSSVQLLNCFPSFRWSRHWLLYEKTSLWQHLVLIQASALQTIALVTNLAVDPWPLTSAISQSGTMTLDLCCRVLQESWPVQCRHALTLTDTPTIAFFTLYVYTESRANSTLIPGWATCWPSVISTWR